MRSLRAAAARVVATSAAAALLIAGLTVAGPLSQAAADTAPTDAGTPSTVSATSLPTVQVNGVVWSQVIVGGTVYVAGDFTTARPAGAAAGVSTVGRANLLAYDLDSGVLIDTWAPVLNGPAYTITASLDGTRLYVGGDFTYVNGSPQNRIVVLDRATGLRVPGFTVGANAAVRAIVSTPSTIYFAGNFNTVTGATRNRLAAMSSTTGALLSWAVSAQSLQVDALVLSPDNSRLIVGGRFTMLGGIPALGSGAVSTTTAAVLPWAANSVIKNWGAGAGIQSLQTDGTLIYGTGFAYIKDATSAGNLEGTFAADPNTGEIEWVEDCRGDTYSVFANPGGSSVYVVGHIHNCQNIGAYPESNWKHGLAFSKQAVSTITPSTSSSYYNWAGYRAPAQLAYYPDFTVGSYTGQGQATWQVTGNADYVLYGGEFPTVNGSGQQGLARMAVSAKSTNVLPLKLSSTAMAPAALSRAAGTAQVSWQTNWDQDNETLTYDVYRDNETTPIYSVKANSLPWQLPRVSFSDSGLANGSAHTYKVTASDPFGNSVTSSTVSVTVAGASAGPLSTYAAEILGDNPAAYWRLAENSGQTADLTAWGSASVGSGVTRAVTGALTGDSNRAARFTGSSTSRAAATKSAVGSNRFSVEAWFTTTSTTGGKIVGFGSSSGTSNSSSNDRHVYMRADGTLTFGVYPGEVRTVTTPASYNDGQWHHVVATLGADGMKLYVDGAERAADATTISAQPYTGYWRIGGDALSSTWPGAAGENFVGDIDDVAVYGRALPASQVAIHYGTGQSGAIPNLPPTAAFTADPGVLTASFDASASTDFEGPIAGYAWDFGDGQSGTGVSATHAYDVGGTYTVTLTVTDSGGTTNATSQQVVVRAPNVLPVASFTATNTDLTAAFDATSSTDSDGTIPTYAWTFGDGSTGTGATTTHTYAAAGTYPVTLTVTDNDGGSDGADGEVTVTAPTAGVVASDAFGRTVSNGFGSADLGGAWATTSGVTSVASGTGRLQLGAASSTVSARLPGVSGTQLTTRVTESWSKRPNGSGGWLLVRGRITTGGEYRLRVGHTFSGAVTARLVRTTAAGVETSITTDLTVPGLTYTTGTTLKAAFEVTGTSPTTLRAKVWVGSGVEPAGWLIEATDTTAALQAAGHTGVAALLSSSTTNGPVTVQVDNFTVDGPFSTTNVSPVASFTAATTGLTADVDAAASSDPDGTIAGYAWSFGDGSTGTGATASHTYATAGTFTITLTVTDSGGATATTTRQVSVEPVNQVPIASFTAASSLLTADVDATGSSDPDGTIAGYAWSFGDGGTATGATASHAYTAGGTYTITLTVTDNSGATATTTRDVTVALANVPPTASFTATATGLSAAVDAAGSSDPDGTISSYAWTFGDGATATGVTASHDYASTGTYTVTLTVTDSDGATATTTRDLSVAPVPTALATDAFGRTVASGLGDADLGGAWTATAGATSVSGGAGRLALSGVNVTASARLPGISGTTLTTRVVESWDKRPAGSGGWFLLRGRITTGGEYRLRINHRSNGVVTARVMRTNSAGTETAITTELTVPGVTYAAGTGVTLLFEVSTTTTTSLRAKVWATGTSEPAAWLISATDSTAALQGSGHTGVAALTSSTATNAPITVSIDDYTVTQPAP
ncbi:PKD domain-containing protein [Pengzhenrongella sicca]|uniref:PKD domain-containing protein n=1 Tax=Pengzhenrongella sicca TaxID=2819238 RepID=A0A8A4ZEC5_9MICO|nr:PKD domain-containing protein [Pengzhenrongella sicca]QTE28896.1 PKD domain-containing protein [Pengzhenrongella sicca]